MNELFKENAGMKEIIVHLMNDNVILNAKLQALNASFEALFRLIDPNYNPSIAQDLREKNELYFAQQIIADHPLYSDWWKNQMKDLNS